MLADGPTIDDTPPAERNFAINNSVISLFDKIPNTKLPLTGTSTHWYRHGDQLETRYFQKFAEYGGASMIVSIQIKDIVIINETAPAETDPAINVTYYYHDTANQDDHQHFINLNRTMPYLLTN
jgi:hypothetical protein